MEKFRIQLAVSVEADSYRAALSLLRERLRFRSMNSDPITNVEIFSSVPRAEPPPNHPGPIRPPFVPLSEEDMSDG